MVFFKRQRGSHLQRAVAGLVLGSFGVLWVLIVSQVTAPYGWPVVVALGSIGALLTCWYWGLAAYHLAHATSQQRYAEDDHAPNALSVPLPPVRRCEKCRAELSDTYRFCPQCGLKI